MYKGDIARLKNLNEWYGSKEAGAINSLESIMLDPILDHFRPYNTLQLGGKTLLNAKIDGNYLLANCILGNETKDDDALVIDYDRMPFISNYFDLVVCAHLHESIVRPEALFAEAARVLSPEGLMVLFTINPHGLIGLKKFLAGSHNIDLNWRINKFTQKVLVNKMSCLKLEYVYHDYKGYNLDLVNGGSCLKYTKVLEKYLPAIGGVCKLVFRKREEAFLQVLSSEGEAVLPSLG